MAKKSKGPQQPTPIKADVESEGSPPLPSLSPEQQAQAQRLQRDHAVLKAKFADVSVDLDVATRERDQILARLQQAQQIIQNLSQELQAARKGSAEKDAEAETPATETETPSEE